MEVFPRVPPCPLLGTVRSADITESATVVYLPTAMTVHRLTNPEPADQPAPAPTEPLTIEISKDVHTADPDAPEGWRVDTRTEQFTVRADLPSILVLQLATVGSRDPADREDGEFAGLLWSAYEDSFTPGEFRRFQKWSRDVKASIGDLVSWCNQIVGVISNRPTGGPSPSPAGVPETLNGSTAPGEPEQVTQVGPGSAI